MELLPKYSVFGVITPPLGVPGGPKAPTPDVLNRIWSEIGPQYGYRRLELSADGTAAQIVGATDEDGVNIQPPVLQVLGNIRMTAQQSAEQAHAILKVITQHLGLTQFFNLGIKYIFHAPAPGKDGRAFVLHRLLGKDEVGVNGLQRGADLWTGVKYVVSDAEGNAFTLLVEPLIADNTFLFLDLDAQFPGLMTLDDLKERAQDTERYMSQTVSSYLDGLSAAG
ncbi:MAG: hypothetical protein M3P18_09545 [Actinomycetota bacterium]|nr:hypothetical protein [Actinomycetota bacterium]